LLSLTYTTELNGKYGKHESLFGKGIYFSIDQLVAENFLEFQVVDRPGYAPHKMACVAGCRIADDPKQVCTSTVYNAS
jgi:hypothetical protein